MQGGIELRRMAAVDFVEAIGNGGFVALPEKLGDGFRVQFAPRHSQPAGGGFRLTEQFVRNRYGGLDLLINIIIEVIPNRLLC
jgi:hypothetical protein